MKKEQDITYFLRETFGIGEKEAQNVLFKDLIEIGILDNDLKDQLLHIRERYRQLGAKKNHKMFFGVSVTAPHYYNFVQHPAKVSNVSPLAALCDQKLLGTLPIRVGFISEIELSAFEWKDFDLLMRIPSTLVIYERLVLLIECQKMFDIHTIKHNHLFCALNTSEYSGDNNMGSMSIIGEVVLRIVLAVIGLANNPAEDETSMANFRDSHLNKLRLAQIAKETGLIFFVQQRMSLSKKFQYPGSSFNLQKNSIKQNLSVKKSYSALVSLASKIRSSKVRVSLVLAL